MLKKILIAKVYLPIIYVVVGIIIYSILSRIVDKVLVMDKGHKHKSKLAYKREKTIINLVKNILKYIIAIIILLAILNVYGVKTTSIIASLGIVGAIVGLAFQDTIKNLLCGISIIFDNHFVQGDIVTINGFKGEVIELGLQTTKVKAYDGEVMIINNNMITSVINHSMYNTNLYIDIPISNNVSLKDIEDILSSINKKIVKLKEVENKISMLGIDKLNSNNYVYKIMIECKPENHYSVSREFMKYLKDAYDERGINVPSEYLEVKNVSKK